MENKFSPYNPYFHLWEKKMMTIDETIAFVSAIAKMGVSAEEAG